MAVKKRKTRSRKHENASLECLVVRLTHQHSFQTSKNDVLICCDQIIEFLTGFNLEVTEISTNTVDKIHNCLVLLASSLTIGDVEDIIYDVVRKIYITVTEAEKYTSSSMTTVFVLFSMCSSEFVDIAALNIVGQMDHGKNNRNLRILLSVFCSWLVVCKKTHEFGNWVLAFIRALEANNHIDILFDVTMQFVKPLFRALNGSLYSRPIVEDVIFHILSCLRHSEKVLEKIADCVPIVLMALAQENKPWSRQVLQRAADILNAIVHYQSQKLNETERDDFKKKYEELFECLEKYIASTGKQLDQPLWENITSDAPKQQQDDIAINKVGLFNKGNMCYLNSVIQALFLTRQFSNYVMLKNDTASYWWNLAVTFAKMLFSQKKIITPDELLNAMVTKNFPNTSQHDSSEFLVFLFGYLQQHDTNINYFCHGNMGPATSSTSLPFNNVINSADEELSLSPIARVGSPRVLSPLKRQNEENINTIPPKKPWYNDVNTINPTSILDECFAGIQVTHVTCVTCNFMSYTQDKFRDLQLAYPEKSDNSGYNVQDLLDFYCSAETLSGDNKYDCPNCQDRIVAHRSVTIDIAPRHLILVLKHFKYDPKNSHQNKLNYSTYYNLTITLPTLSGSQIKYNIYAAVVHVGASINVGHYYTIGKDDNQWYRLDDDKIKLIKEGALNEMSAIDSPYILFYRREDCEDVPPPSLAELPPLIRAELNVVPTKIYSPTMPKKSY